MGYAFMRLLLAEDGYDITAKEDEIYYFIISVSKGNENYESIIKWIKKNSKRL